jgi:sugar lactone lactonase YvrE
MITWADHHRLACLTIVALLAAPFDCQGQAVITTSVGNGSLGFTGDGGPASSATLGFVKGVAVDSVGNLYIADGLYNRIRKVDTSGIITTVAGNGVPFFAGDGGPGKNASISLCGVAPHQGIAADNHGNLYIADCANNRIRKVDSSGIITTFAGIGGTTAFSGDGGPATSASLGLPYGVAVDGQGNVYIADTGNGRIRKVDTAGIITTVAGKGNGFILGDGGLATNAQLANPSDVVVDGQGNLYIADFGNSRVRKVNTAGIISTIAVGSFGVCPSTGTYVDVGGVVDLALDSAGNLYMADESSDCVHKLDTSGKVTTVAGGGLALPGDGGPATSAALGKISDVDVDSQGNVFISDPNEFRIRKVTPAAICNIALGTGGQAFSDRHSYRTGPEGNLCHTATRLPLNGSMHAAQHHPDGCRRYLLGEQGAGLNAPHLQE